MGVGPCDARGLSFYEYDALLFHWERTHSSDDDVGPPPSESEVTDMFLRMERAGLARIN